MYKDWTKRQSTLDLLFQDDEKARIKYWLKSTELLNADYNPNDFATEYSEHHMDFYRIDKIVRSCIEDKIDANTAIGLISHILHTEDSDDKGSVENMGGYANGEAS